MTVTVVVSLQLTMESYSLFMILITKFSNKMFFVFNISTFASYSHCIFILPWTFVVLYVYIFFMSYFIPHLYYQDKKCTAITPLLRPKKLAILFLIHYTRGFTIYSKNACNELEKIAKKQFVSCGVQCRR